MENSNRKQTLKLHISDRSIKKDVYNIVSNTQIEVVEQPSIKDIKDAVKQMPKGTGVPLGDFFNEYYKIVTLFLDDPAVKLIIHIKGVITLGKILTELTQIFKVSKHKLHIKFRTKNRILIQYVMPENESEVEESWKQLLEINDKVVNFADNIHLSKDDFTPVNSLIFKYKHGSWKCIINPKQSSENTFLKWLRKWLNIFGIRSFV
tara:strand:+ start:117 stop:734 length:618 start_codon:yes stop_codon:yes gene_type:complete